MQEISLAGNPELFCEVDGWIAPVRGRGKRPTDALNWAKSEARRLSRVYAFCEQRRTVIQAGGNVGVFPAKLAPVFQRVITVEPDARNYVALVANTAHLVNVESYRAAFGAESSTASVHQIDPGNSGTCSIVDGSDFPVYPIDALGVQDCDLLLLDVEGYELFARRSQFWAGLWIVHSVENRQRMSGGTWGMMGAFGSIRRVRTYRGRVYLHLKPTPPPPSNDRTTERMVSPIPNEYRMRWMRTARDGPEAPAGAGNADIRDGSQCAKK